MGPIRRRALLKISQQRQSKKLMDSNASTNCSTTKMHDKGCQTDFNLKDFINYINNKTNEHRDQIESESSSSSSNYNKETRIKRPYARKGRHHECSLCPDKVYKTKGHYLLHMKYEHGRMEQQKIAHKKSEQSSLNCDVCEKKCITRAGLIQHKKKCAKSLRNPILREMLQSTSSIERSNSFSSDVASESGSDYCSTASSSKKSVVSFSSDSEDMRIEESEETYTPANELHFISNNNIVDKTFEKNSEAVDWNNYYYHYNNNNNIADSAFEQKSFTEDANNIGNYTINMLETNSNAICAENDYDWIINSVLKEQWIDSPRMMERAEEAIHLPDQQVNCEVAANVPFYIEL